MLRLSALLVGSGHEVHFIIAENGENEFPMPAGVVLHRAGTRNPVRLSCHLKSKYEELKPQIVYSGMPNYNGIAIIAKLLSPWKPKIIISERSHSLVELRNTKMGIYKASILLSPFLYRLADKILAVSADTADSLSQFTRIPRRKISVMHNPVVSEKIGILAAAPLEHEWLLPPHELIVAVGRLAPQKDYPTLLAAFQVVHLQRPTARLAVVGEGPDRHDLTKLAKELQVDHVVHFVGFDTNPYRWMANSRVFVLTSLWEGLPTVIIEALACGASIVATDSPSGPRQILGNDERLGFLVPMKAPTIIAEKLIWALDNPLPKERLVLEAENYSEEASLVVFERAVQEVLPTASSGPV